MSLSQTAETAKQKTCFSGINVKKPPDLYGRAAFGLYYVKIRVYGYRIKSQI